MPAGGDRFPEEESWDRLFYSDCEPFVENQWGYEGRGGMAESGRDVLFCSLECLNCWQLCDGVVKHKVLFRAGWKHTFRIPGSDNVSPGDGADWVKVTQCVSWELTGKI